MRSWQGENKTASPSLNRLNYRTGISDAIRFRYEVNFLEDGKRLHELILREARNGSCRIGRVLVLKRTKCNVDEPLTKRKKGERSWKLFFVHKTTDYQIELQICTQLQIAWDKKDHFLIYERSRRSMNVQPGDIILMKHVSDQLYVVDRQLDELRKKIQSELRTT